MRIGTPLLGVALLIVLMLPCRAGPCAPQIDALQIQIDAKLNAVAAAGREGTESAAATDHRQPTPKSIAAAEIKLGDVSQKQVEAIGDAMRRARAADQAGDDTRCDNALAEARKALGD